MIPDGLLETVTSVGNAAGDGCRAAFLDRKKRKEADQLRSLVTYIELTMEEKFQDELVAAT